MRYQLSTTEVTHRHHDHSLSNFTLVAWVVSDIFFCNVLYVDEQLNRLKSCWLTLIYRMEVKCRHCSPNMQLKRCQYLAIMDHWNLISFAFTKSCIWGSAIPLFYSLTNDFFTRTKASGTTWTSEKNYNKSWRYKLTWNTGGEANSGFKWVPEKERLKGGKVG